MCQGPYICRCSRWTSDLSVLPAVLDQLTLPLYWTAAVSRKLDKKAIIEVTFKPVLKLGAVFGEKLHLAVVLWLSCCNEFLSGVYGMKSFTLYTICLVPDYSGKC